MSPQLAVIPVGDDNPFGHPSEEVMDRLKGKLGSENIYRTDEHGTIEFITDGERLWVKVETRTKQYFLVTGRAHLKHYLRETEEESRFIISS